MLDAIDELPEEEREAFELVRIHGLTHTEAAEVLKVSTKTVQRRLNHALHILAAALADLELRRGPGQASGTKGQAGRIARYLDNWDKSWADHTSGWVSHVLRREAERMILPELSASLNGTHQPQGNDERLALLGDRSGRLTPIWQGCMTRQNSRNSPRPNVRNAGASGVNMTRC